LVPIANQNSTKVREIKIRFIKTHSTQFCRNSSCEIIDLKTLFFLFLNLSSAGNSPVSKTLLTFYIIGFQTFYALSNIELRLLRRYPLSSKCNQLLIGRCEQNSRYKTRKTEKKELNPSAYLQIKVNAGLMDELTASFKIGGWKYEHFR